MSASEFMPVIHRFWAGKPMPEDYEVYGWMWQDLNPGWRVETWDLRCLEDFPDLQPVIDDLYKRDAGRNGIELFVQIADVVGYALVRKWGGVYVNCDMQPVRPLPELPDMAWASLENDVERDVVNAAIGASQPQDPFWVSLLEELPRRYFRYPGAEMVKTTGPGLLTDHARAHPDKIHVFPRTTFNPVHWSRVTHGEDASVFLADLPEDTVALHHWGHRRDGRSNIVETATS